jgi:integrase
MSAESNQPGQAKRPAAGFGKSTSKFWEGKVYRPLWRDEDGQYREVSNYFVRLMVSGRREARALNTADRLEAAKKASQIYMRIRAIGWDAALREFDPERHTPKTNITIGNVIKILNQADLRARTKANYINALRWFAARFIGYKANKKSFGPSGSAGYRQEVEVVKLADLKQEAVREIIDKHVREAGEVANAGRSARISVASFLRNAKAALSKAEQEGLVIPDPKPFSGVKKPEGATAPAYTSTLDAGAMLRRAKKELEHDGCAYIGVLLAVGAGLRRGEIANLLWRCVDSENDRVLVLASGGWAPKTGESEQPVHVSFGLIEELEQFRTKPDDHVTNPAALDRAVTWLRANGVDTHKPLHTLRKEFGSIINESADLYTASKALRHSSLSVTAGVYVDSRKRVAPDIRALLTPKPKKERNEGKPA